MKNIITIIKKEFKRIFSDKRLILALFMPGVFIFVMYTIMGEAMINMIDTTKETITIYSINMPQEVEASLISLKDDNYNFEIHQFSLSELDDKILQIKEQEIDYIVIFEEDFLNKVLSKQAPDVKTYYNPVNTKSTTADAQVNIILLAIKENIIYSELGTIFTINKDNNPIVVKNSNSVSAYIISLMLPMLLVTFIFTGSLNFSTESIAGEKERGSLATLLVSPIKRSEIALGKTLGLSAISLISATSSFLGIMFSLPKLMQVDDVDFGSIYGPMDYLSLFLIIIVLAVLFNALVSTISAFSKNVKEAQMFSVPLMVILIVLSLVPSFVSSSSIVYYIPVYNATVVLSNIFQIEYEMWQIFVTLGINVLVISGFIYLLTRMFNSEKIMFNK